MASVAPEEIDILSAARNFRVILTHLRCSPNVTLSCLQKYACFHVGLEK